VWVCVCVCVCVCVERGGGEAYLYTWRSVPAISSHGNVPNRLVEDQIFLLAKVHLDALQGGFGRTWGLANPPLLPLVTAFDRGTDRWVHISILCVSHFYTSVWSVMWAFSWMCDTGCDLLWFLLRLTSCFHLIPLLLI
jgi:hypothetical protein